MIIEDMHIVWYLIGSPENGIAELLQQRKH